MGGESSLDERRQIEASSMVSPPEADAQPGVMSTLGGQLLSSSNVAASHHKETPAERAEREYNQKHGQYEKDLDKYWNRVDADKAKGQLISEFPPVYTGPADPNPTKHPPRQPSTLPNLNEMVAHSKDLQRVASGNSQAPDFNLSSLSEKDFKQRYAAEAVKVGALYGFGKDDVRNIVESIYAFEDGGWGTYETLSSMPPSLVKPDKPGETTIHDRRMDFRSVSTAVGYNQLLMFNTVKDVHEQGPQISAELTAMAKNDPARAQELTAKAKMVTELSGVLSKELKVLAATDPKTYIQPDGSYSEQLYADFSNPDKLIQALPANDPMRQRLTNDRNMSIGIHGLNLDGDIGPIIQARELDNLFSYAQQHGFGRLLAAKEKADKAHADAFDKLSPAAKTAAAHELVGLTHGSAATKQAMENTIASLKPGPDDALTDAKLTPGQRGLLDDQILELRRFGQPTGPLSHNAQLALDKAWYSHYGGPSAADMMAAALELANLAGTGKARDMINPKDANFPTVNWFTRRGYERNPVTHMRTADELLMSIYHTMHDSWGRDPKRNPSQGDFDKSFDALP